MNLSLLYKKLRSLKVHKISINNVRTPFGEAYDDNNHWVKTLKEYDSGIRAYKQTSLYKYHQEFQPKSIFSILEIDDKSKLEERYPLGTCPWGGWTQKNTTEKWLKTRQCGPTLDKDILSEYDDFIAVYLKIKKEGLNFKKYGYPIGSIFKKDEQKFFFVYGGMHRIAIAKYLNYENIEFRVISRNNIKQIVNYNHLKDINDIRLFDNLISLKFKE